MRVKCNVLTHPVLLLLWSELLKIIIMKKVEVWSLEKKVNISGFWKAIGMLIINNISLYNIRVFALVEENWF